MEYGLWPTWPHLLLWQWERVVSHLYIIVRVVELLTCTALGCIYCVRRVCACKDAQAQACPRAIWESSRSDDCVLWARRRFRSVVLSTNLLYKLRSLLFEEDWYLNICFESFSLYRIGQQKSVQRLRFAYCRLCSQTQWPCHDELQLWLFESDIFQLKRNQGCGVEGFKYNLFSNKISWQSGVLS